MLTRSIARLRLYSPDTQSSLQHSSLRAISDCLLHHLPKEMFHHILSFLSISDWGQLCLVSKQTRNMVMSWVASQSCLSILTCRLSSVTNTETRMQLWLHLCSQFGLLCKRATMLCNTKNRLSHLVKWFSYLSQLGCEGLTFQWSPYLQEGRTGCLSAWTQPGLGRVRVCSDHLLAREQVPSHASTGSEKPWFVQQTSK